MITIKEIAAEAGVSVMTVSNVINNNHARVSRETEKRVRDIMEKHHYVPNMAARSLISKASHIIALLLPIWYETPDSMLLDPYVGQIAGMLESELREHQYYVMICSFRTAEEVLQIQRTWQIDGSILIVPHEDKVSCKLVKRTESPLVVLDRHFDDLPMMSVCLDDWKGGYMATRHLLEKGHRRIGFAAPTIGTSYIIKERFRGYQEALREYGLTENPAWVFGDATHQKGGEMVGAAIAGMSERPTAMVATEDLIACGIIKGCQAHGLRVPDDLSVIGFDDSMPARLITPALTTIGQDVREKARCAAKVLLRAIEEKDERSAHVVLDVTLVERESVAAIGMQGSDAAKI